MAEIRFYHLTETPLEAALPAMLDLALGRGWRCLVRGGDTARLLRLDAHLWEVRDESFLPHGLASEAHAARQPVLLSGDPTGNPNRASALFLIDGMPLDAAEVRAFVRVSVLFDGHDPLGVEKAREQWRGVARAELAAAYWAQGVGGRWEKRSETSTAS